MAIMLKERARLIDAGLRFFDLFALVVAFPVAYVFRDRALGERFTNLYPMARYWPLLVLTPLLWIVASWLSRVYAGYRTRSMGTELLRIGSSMAFVALAMAAAGFLSRREDVSRLFVIVYFTIALLLLVANRIVTRSLARMARQRGYNTRAFAVVGSGALAREIAAEMAERREWGYQFAGFILEDGAEETARGRDRVLGRLSQLGALLESQVLDEIIFAVSRERLGEIEGAVLLCEEQGVATKVCLNFFPRRIAKLSVEEQLPGIPMLSFSTTPTDAPALVLKRAFDVVVSGVVLLLLSPLFFGIALAIRIDSPGPVFFRQLRVGRNGRGFYLYKFRSMRADAEKRMAELRALNEATGPVFKMARDPRITRVGGFLRKSSLDELPQFWNVLRGDMSVVGPRPPIPSEVKEYQRWQRRRLSMSPGITCIWQVSGRSNIDFDRWMELDLQYIDNWSLWDDLKICAKTIPAVLTGRGAR